MTGDCLYLIHIKECLDRIRQYTAEGRASFFDDIKTQDAVLRNLQTLAESTQRLSEAAKASHQEIDWRAIAGFRNVLVHDYLGVDLQQVWDIVVRDLPPLEACVTQLLQDHGD